MGVPIGSSAQVGKELHLFHRALEYIEQACICKAVEAKVLQLTILV